MKSWCLVLLAICFAAKSAKAEEFKSLGVPRTTAVEILRFDTRVSNFRMTMLRGAEVSDLRMTSRKGGAGAQETQKDYLTSMEADKIRDAETTNDRIKLFLTFADDRLKKFQYELEHPSQTNHEQMLNFLMNAYIGCVDDAADLIQLGVEKQENIRRSVDLMATKTKEYLEVLKKIQSDGKEIEIYRDNLDDAIEGTQDAMNDAEKAKKSVAPPPVRRKS